jgi:hypothetical protein
MTIAALMCQESMTYMAAFAHVKSCRAVCSPNAGFLCQLIELQTQRSDRTKRPLVYQYTSHAQHDLSTWILKPCRLPNTRTCVEPAHVVRYETGLFLFIEEKQLRLWVGRDAHDDVRIKDMQEDVEKVDTHTNMYIRIQYGFRANVGSRKAR